MSSALVVNIAALVTAVIVVLFLSGMLLKSGQSKTRDEFRSPLRRGSQDGPNYGRMGIVVAITFGVIQVALQAIQILQNLKK